MFQRVHKTAFLWRSSPVSWTLLDVYDLDQVLIAFFILFSLNVMS